MNILLSNENPVNTQISPLKSKNESITNKNPSSKNTSLSKKSVFNLFDEGNDSLFEQPKKNIKVLSFLDDEDEDNPLSSKKSIKSNDIKEEKVI